MRTAVIVQARGGSTRLPGKVLLDVAGKPVLQHVVERCQAIPGADLVVCAVPDEPASKPLEEIATHCGAVIFRGSEQDVLARYHGAALAARADVVMRVTSDCPLIDPEICGEVLALRAQTGADYAANNMPPSYPHGLDCEAFSFAVLAQAAEQALSAEDREHVTPWLRRAEGIRRVNLSSGVPTLAAHRWTLDYPEDIAFLRALGEELVDISAARMWDIVQALDRRPEIGYINASRRVR